ncbi:MAG: LysM peptidoglycan-binding domain-containing protein [Deltaproteobacteria bacterium]|nr:MAG: LysM peptidoglycan-binding domain-containing protein [Deltaproteobacteria bacterium]
MSLLPASLQQQLAGEPPLPDVSLDRETFDDTLLLTGFDQQPPASEGVNRPAGDGFDLPVVLNDKVQYFIDYYTGPGHKVFARWLKRSGRYMPMMRDVFARHGLPRDLAWLAMVESGFNERAYSWAHAVGPWQFIASTANMYGLKTDWWRDERRDFVKSTEAAARFLKDLGAQFDNNWYLAVASYNAGPGKIRRAIRKYGTSDFWKLSRGNYLQQETRNYVPKLLAVLLITRDPARYGFADVEKLEPLRYDEVALPSATDLEVIARLAGCSYDEVKRLNPELLRWSTPPGERGYVIRLPEGSYQRFVEGYAALDPRDRIHYLRHRVRPGDTLLKLAQKHHIRVEDIIALNDIANPRALRVGTDLILPLKKGYTRRPLEELRDDYIRTYRRTYTVRKGDSLWKIATRFGVTEKELRVWNRLGWSNLLHPGQKLIVSAKAVRHHRSRSSRHAGPVKKIVYKVRSGDTLWDIGRRYRVATRQIRVWNNLDENHVLHPGDKLTLMVPADRG